LNKRRASAIPLHTALPYAVALCCIVLTVATASAQQRTITSSRDYEDCVDTVKAFALTREALATTIAECDSRFPGRRKADGGYTYYDFMQNRHFDIAGPIPTAKELKQIDQEFIRYLAARNPSADSPDDKRARAIRAETSKPVSKPRIASHTGPSAHTQPRPSQAKPKPLDCKETPVACGWASLTTQVKSVAHGLFGPPPKEVKVSRLQRRDRPAAKQAP
jgi:hypothetical protein